MWCTRWFLPLLILPLPTAPPYFLLLFILSLTIHAKPCFYCIVLLTTLFVSSCYWQPFSLDSPLSTPWSENVTTFAEALNNTLGPHYTKSLPVVIQAVDRCWCDFSAGGLFEPFNVTRWEYISVQRLKEDLERKVKIDKEEIEKSQNHSTSITLTGTPAIPFDLTMIPQTPAPSILPNSAGQDLRSIFRLFQYAFKGDPTLDPSTPAESNEDIPEPLTSPVDMDLPSSSSSPQIESPQPLFRREYDLRPYGFGILVDFGWTR